MSKIKVNEVEINGEVYVKKSDMPSQPAEVLDGKEYCIVRTYSAGVFAGYIDRDSIKDQSATVYQARRIWYWAGAASLSQLSVDGTSKPDACKFPCEVAEVTLTQIIEVIPCTEKARTSINEVKAWTE